MLEHHLIKHQDIMRTTLTLEEDVAQQVRRQTKQFHLPFKQVINRALRLGLEQMIRAKPRRTSYRTISHSMGIKSGYNLDNIQDLISQIEGENSR